MFAMDSVFFLFCFCFYFWKGGFGVLGGMPGTPGQGNQWTVYTGSALQWQLLILAWRITTLNQVRPSVFDVLSGFTSLEAATLHTVMASLYNQATLLILGGVFLLTPATADHVSDQDKIDCYPEVGNQTLCESRGCTWEESRTKVANKNNLKWFQVVHSSLENCSEWAPGRS